MKRFFILLLISVSFISVSAQTIAIGTDSKPVDWNDLKAWMAHPEDFDVIPSVSGRISLGFDANVSAKLANLNLEPLSEEEKQNLLPVLEQLEKTPTVEASVAWERKQPYLVYSFNPLIFKNGAWQKILTYKITAEVAPKRQQRKRQGNYAKQSALSTGEWYKIGLTTSGMHKVTGADLANLGLGSEVKSADIKLFGNGGQMLPLSNGDFRLDDLMENAITVVDGGDGVINSEDYILFYGQGPHGWVPSALPPFRQYERNVFTDTAFYFLTTDVGVGKRVQKQSDPGATNNTVTTVPARAAYELETINLIQSGRRFYGETFDANNASKTFDFNLPNLLEGEETHVKVISAGRTIANGIKVSASINNQSIGSSFGFVVPATGQKAYAIRSTLQNSLTGISHPVEVTVDFTHDPAHFDSKAWLDRIEVQGQRSLTMSGNELHFDFEGADGRISGGVLKNADSKVTIWDISEHWNASELRTTSANGGRSFSIENSKDRNLIAFNGNQLKGVQLYGAINNQNIHGTIGQPDMVIIAPDAFRAEAERLAELHKAEDGLEVVVLPPYQVYNEFSSGQQDVAAIRDLMTMLYNRANTTDELPKYLLLLGDGSYDYKGTGFESAAESIIPVYESLDSEHKIHSYVSDDFFGMLDPDEGGELHLSGDLLDIAVGRLPASNILQARAMVDKIEDYVLKSDFGNWRTQLTFITDDHDTENEGGVEHVKDADPVADSFLARYPAFTLQKLYMDLYPEVGASGGARFPAVQEAINRKMFSGTFLLDYIGHGGPSGMAQERVMQISDVKQWQNRGRYPLFITATCTFAPYDNPGFRSIGEQIVSLNKAGAIALVTTVRPVYVSSNAVTNRKLMETIFQRVEGKYRTIGEIVRTVKNNILSSENNRKFTLLGDPAITLAYPEYNVQTTHVNEQMMGESTDTVSALSKVTIKGRVVDESGEPMMGFNGVVYPTIYDKTKIAPLTRVPEDAVVHEVVATGDIIYKGKATVSAGEFEFTFIAPKDINYSFGEGSIRYYAENGVIDAAGHDAVTIGGTSSSFPEDNEGPEVKIFMNDFDFVEGGTTDDSPIMLVTLQDEHGINTSSASVGHDIVAELDGDEINSVVLNEFYTGGLDNYQVGEVSYPWFDLEEGLHTLKVKAWDVYNNSGEGYTEFLVAESPEMVIEQLLNYPNPVVDGTTIKFSHNRRGATLDVVVDIFDVRGNLLHRINEVVFSDGLLVDNITWDGHTAHGLPLNKGVFIYRVMATTETGEQAIAAEKMVLLK